MGKDQRRDAKLLSTVERLYLVFVRSPFRFLFWSEEARIARDILQMDELISVRASLTGFKPRSRYFRQSDFLASIAKDTHLRKDQITQLECEYVSPLRFHITAVFITSLIQIEHRKERFRWRLTMLLSIIGTVLAAIKLIGDLHAKP